MNALSTLFPVFFMIILGMIARIKGFISPEQKEGANHIVFNVLFPILIFNVLFTAKIESSAILIVLYVLIAFTLALVLGKCITKFTGKEVGHIFPYLLTTCEGGNVALPLYTSIVGVAYASNTVIFDIAGTVIAFIIIPVLVAKATSGNTSTKELLKTIFTNSFVIAVMLGVVLNLLGVYDLLSQTAFIDLYTNTIQQALNKRCNWAKEKAIFLFTSPFSQQLNISTNHSHYDYTRNKGNPNIQLPCKQGI